MTLIFYRINPQWWKEPALNIASAVCQMSNLTHCELSIGEARKQTQTPHTQAFTGLDSSPSASHTGDLKQRPDHEKRCESVQRLGARRRHLSGPPPHSTSMTGCAPVCSQVGVELVERTGRNPQNLFIQLGCSKMAEQKMLHYVRTQCVGKPFSNYAMARSLIWPRETNHTSFFCAELVASILKVGGLLDGSCNPGAATPEMLFRIYSPRAAVAANPVLLRELTGGGGGTSSAAPANGFIGNLSPSEHLAEREALLPVYMRSGAAPHAMGVPMARHSGLALPVAPSAPVFQPARRRADSPPRGHFHAVNREYVPLGASRSGSGAGGSGACSARCAASSGLQLTMDSLRMGGGSGGRCKVHPR